MVTFLITFLFTFVILAVAVYFWQKPAAPTTQPVLPPPPERSLFQSSHAIEQPALLPTEPLNRAEILARAQAGDRSVLVDAVADPALYNDSLSALSDSADSRRLLSLASFISQNALPITNPFAKRFIESNAAGADRGALAKILHIAALTDDAETYAFAVEAAMLIWRENKQSISSEELSTLLESEFWVLSSESRSSGAGFVLKQTLADARRELRGSD